MKKYVQLSLLNLSCMFIFIMGCHGLDPSYEACAPKDCGNGLTIKYPFYVRGLQDPSCGYPGFELQCGVNGSTILESDGNRYFVREIFYDGIIRLVLNTPNLTCPSAENITLDPQRFVLDSSSTTLVILTNCSEVLPDCDACERSGGRCGSDITAHQFRCFCHSRPHNVYISCPAAAKHLVISFSIGGAILLAVIILCLVMKIKRKRKNHLSVENFLKNHEFLAPKRYTYSQVKRMTYSFKLKLGQGGFGTVYKGTLNNGKVVAVKVLSKLKTNGEDFINEVASVGRTSHVNIVTLLGFCCDGHHIALIYEFMPNGSLERFIYRREISTNSQLGWEKLHQIAIGVARGLEYLHSGCNTRILHFDIKPHNILLDETFCPKISDFGLAKLSHENKSMISMSHMRGTLGYIAPELVSRNFGQVSHKSDVYSYGMMILEMVGGRTNIMVEVDHTSEIYFPHWIYKKIEVNEEHLELHGITSDEEDEMARKMIIVGLWCIQTNPINRPTITKVLGMLDDDLTLLEIPPKPYLSSPSRFVDSTTTT